MVFMRNGFFGAIIFMLTIFLSFGMKNYLDEEQDVLKRILKGYDWRIRPPGEEFNGTGPVKVKSNLLIRSISNVDEANMAFDIQITFREQWLDKRLVNIF
uniref:Neurotransmitter-gated ion-channel ligand-binding domain-containing protein n=1 Tax=Acrobeloides nanus TaxID=290746 RepID=A0A914CXA1_9BILA